MSSTIKRKGNGKLLLTGEYLVLSGAKALVLPSKFGQFLSAGPVQSPGIYWQSYQQGKLWFKASVDEETLLVSSESQPLVSARLHQVLKAARNLNPEFLHFGNNSGYSLWVDADYPLEWGLGSSSSLIYLIASLAGIDPYKLFRQCSDGSGYDVACASRSEPFFYELKEDHYKIDPAVPGSALRKFAYFGYSGQKVDTAREVEQFLHKRHVLSTDIEMVSRLSEAICYAEDYPELCNLVKEHEQLVGNILGKEPIVFRFPGFPGVVKSLGAWGGDFLMFVSDLSLPELITVLAGYNIRDVFTFDQIKATG